MLRVIIIGVFLYLAFIGRQVESQEDNLEEIEVSLVNEVIENKSDPDSIISRGNTAIENAAYWNRPDLIKTLLSLGAAPDRRRPLSDECDYIYCGTALYIASSRSLEAMLPLIETGADVNYRTKRFEYTPLHNASLYLTPEAVSTLIEAGADINHVDRFRHSVLRTAVRFNRFEIIQELLSLGADVHQYVDDSDSYGVQVGNTLLMNAITYYEVHQNIPTIELLLKYGADPNDSNHLLNRNFCGAQKCGWEGYSVLTYATNQGWSEVVKILLEYGANIDIPDPVGRVAIEIARDIGHIEALQVLENYINENANP